MDTPQPNPPPSRDAEEDAAFVAAVLAGIAAANEGRTVPYEEVRRWMLSWGTDHELPPPQCKSG